MKIVEDISYSIKDIVNQIKDSFGFIYVEDTDHSGYIVLGSGVKLEIVFDEDEKKLNRASLNLPKKEIDFVKDQNRAEIYSSSIESSIQIVDLIKRMLGEIVDD